MKEVLKIRATTLILIKGYPVMKILKREPKRNSIGEIIESYAIITRRKKQTPMKAL